jgi:hypothetical protein
MVLGHAHKAEKDKEDAAFVLIQGGEISRLLARNSSLFSVLVIPEQTGIHAFFLKIHRVILMYCRWLVHYYLSFQLLEQYSMPFLLLF